MPSHTGSQLLRMTRIALIVSSIMLPSPPTAGGVHAAARECAVFPRLILGFAHGGTGLVRTGGDRENRGDGWIVLVRGSHLDRTRDAARDGRIHGGLEEATL